MLGTVRMAARGKYCPVSRYAPPGPGLDGVGQHLSPKEAQQRAHARFPARHRGRSRRPSQGAQGERLQDRSYETKIWVEDDPLLRRGDAQRRQRQAADHGQPPDFERGAHRQRLAVALGSRPRAEI